MRAGWTLKVILCLSVMAAAISAEAIKPDRKYIMLPHEMGLIYKNIDVVTKDGYRIETWFYPAQPMPDKDAGQDKPLPYRTIDGERRPTIIICNGDAANMSYQQIWLAEMYCANGYNVVTFDWRGFGKSDEFSFPDKNSGINDEDFLCWTEMLYDYKAVIRVVSKMKEVDKKRIFLFGWSTGAYLSMIAAHDNRQVAGMFACSTPSSFEDAIPILEDLHKVKGKERHLKVPEDFPADKMPIYLAPRFHKPIFLIVGAEDTRTPQWMSEKIIAALPEDTYSRLSVFEGVGHGGMESPYIIDLPRFMTETLDFLDNSLGKKQ